jgi:hypothetical protein
LLVIAELVQIVRDDLGVQRPAGPFDAALDLFLHHHHAVQAIDTGAAELLGHGDAQKPQASGAQPRLAIDVLLLLPLLGFGKTLRFEEAAKAFAKLLVFAAEQAPRNEIDARHRTHLTHEHTWPGGLVLSSCLRISPHAITHRVAAWPPVRQELVAFAGASQ